MSLLKVVTSLNFLILLMSITNKPLNLKLPLISTKSLFKSFSKYNQNDKNSSFFFQLLLILLLAKLGFDLKNEVIKDICIGF